MQRNREQAERKLNSAVKKNLKPAIGKGCSFVDLRGTRINLRKTAWPVK